MTPTELTTISNIHRQAFGDEEDDEVAGLPRRLLKSPETISICVKRDGEVVGNVLFTPFRFHDHPAAICCLRAPLGLSPEHHGRELGRELMAASDDRLRTVSADLQSGGMRFAYHCQPCCRWNDGFICVAVRLT